MKTQVTFRHFNGQHPKLHQAAEDIAANFTKYHNGIVSTNVEFIIDTEKSVNITVHLQGAMLHASYTSDDFHKCLNAAADKIIKQIQKRKDKRNESRKSGPRDTIIEDTIEEDDNDNDIEIELESEDNDKED